MHVYILFGKQDWEANVIIGVYNNPFAPIRAYETAEMKAKEKKVFGFVDKEGRRWDEMSIEKVQVED